MRQGTHAAADEEHLPGQRGFGLVEALVAILVFFVGMLAVSGLSLSVGQLTARSAFRTDQVLAADQVFSSLAEQDFGAVTGGTRTVPVGGHSYTVDVAVTTLSADVKLAEVAVSGVATVPPDTFRTALHRSDAYPTSP